MRKQDFWNFSHFFCDYYRIKTLFDDDTLIIGFAMNHPGGVFSIRELEELLQGPNGKRNGAQRNGLNGNGTNGNGVNRPANGANIPTTSTAATAPTTSTGAIAEVIPDGPQIPPGVIGVTILFSFYLFLFSEFNSLQF